MIGIMPLSSSGPQICAHYVGATIRGPAKSFVTARLSRCCIQIPVTRVPAHTKPRVKTSSADVRQPSQRAAEGLPLTWEDIDVGHLVLAKSDAPSELRHFKETVPAPAAWIPNAEL